MFEIGELVAYGSRGVYQISGIGSLDGRPARPEEKTYYILADCRGKGAKVYIPVNQSKTSLRKVITREQTIDLIERLPNLPMLQVENEKNREQRYKETMGKHDCEEWMRILKTLYGRICERRRLGKKATSMDERYLQAVKKCLLEEFSVSLAITPEEVERVIREKCDTNM